MYMFEAFEKIQEMVFKTPEWEAMRATRENSQWHREDNVAVHTLMTLRHYIENFYEHRTDQQKLITMIALLFHDFGKPDAEEKVAEADGSTRNRYAGHELISSNAFMDFIMKHHDIRVTLDSMGVGPDALAAIRFMIERHLPYSLEMANKRKILRFNLRRHLDKFGGIQIFYDMLRSDSGGRISDDHATKLQAVEDWIAAFDQVEDIDWQPIEGRPQLVVLSGIAGAGKSTYLKTFLEQHPDFEVYSLDIERENYVRSLAQTEDQLDWLTDYKATDPKAFSEYCYYTADDGHADFKKFANGRFEAMIRAKKNVIVDNMSLARKGTRATCVNFARQMKYNIHGIEFWIALGLAQARQHTRPDKFVRPKHVAENYLTGHMLTYTGQYDSKKGRMTFVEGEFDTIERIFVIE